MVVFIVSAIVLGAVMTACSASGGVYEPADYIAADTSVNYADSVFLNTEKYPFLEDQGLFIAKSYADGIPRLLKADSPEGIAAFDKTKPTFVITHGVQFNIGRYGTIVYPTSTEYEISGFNWERIFDGGYQEPTIEMTEIFYRLGYNVLSFQYGRFSESTEMSAGGFNLNIDFLGPQKNIMTTTYGVKAMNAAGEWTDGDAIGSLEKPFSVTQLYAAEYSRFARLVGDYAAEKEVMFVGHSMGGYLTPLAAHLVTELADAGQLDKSYVPDRVTLQDPYCGWMYGDDEAEVAWSGKKIPDGSARTLYVAALENLAYNDIAVEMYTNRYEMVPFFGLAGMSEMKQNRQNILKLVAYTQIYPRFVSGNPTITGHNAVREWHMLSVLAGTPKLEYNGSEIAVLTAATSTARVKELRGYAFVQGYKELFDPNAPISVIEALPPEGGVTIYPDDDTFFIESVYDFSEYTPVYGKIVFYK